MSALEPVMDDTFSDGQAGIQVDDASTAPLLVKTINAVALVALLLAVGYLYREWRTFISLGPGGTPQTLLGFLKIFILSFTTVSNPYEAPSLRGDQVLSKGYLQSLPPRAAVRPETRGIAPHRQVTQKGSASAYELLVSRIQQMGTSSPALFTGTSCFEGHSMGLFARHPVNETCAGEICHVHPSDGGSMHLTLHPADVKVVLEASWGERHPLSRGGWFERFVPAGFVLVYAPRTVQDVELVLEIVWAARWLVGVGHEIKAGAEPGSNPTETLAA